MKNRNSIVVSIIVFILIGCSVQAQSLNFNQIINLKGQVGPSATYFPLDTVPAGKTWKITNFGVNAYTGLYLHIAGASYLPMHITGGSSPVYLAPAMGNASSSGVSSAVWMEEGEVLYGRNASTLGSYWLSIIEFNIVP